VREFVVDGVERQINHPGSYCPARSHTRTVSSVELLTTCPPSGVTATAPTLSVWPVRVRTGWPLARSQHPHGAIP